MRRARRLSFGTTPRFTRGFCPPITQRKGKKTGKVEFPMIRKDQKTSVIEANRTHETDTGSPEV